MSSIKIHLERKPSQAPSTLNSVKTVFPALLNHSPSVKYFTAISLEVDYNMYQELISLVITRRRYLEECGYFERKRQEQIKG